jgi:hypothetical protein
MSKAALLKRLMGNDALFDTLAVFIQTDFFLLPGYFPLFSLLNPSPFCRILQ